MTPRLTIVPSGACRRTATSLVGAVALLGGLLAFLGPSSAQAVAAQAPGPCGAVLLAGSSWLGGGGVPVYSNGQNEGSGSGCSGTNYITNQYVTHVESGSEWQCTEMVNRLYLTRGWTRSFWSGNGGESALGAHDSMYDEAPPSLSGQPNGSISYVGPGDVVSINEFDNGVFQADGHVAVVNTPGRVTNGPVDLVSQNSGDPANADVERTANLADGALTIPNSGKWTYIVIGVVHAPTAAAATTRGVRVLGGNLDVPDAMVMSGDDLYVANRAGGSVIKEVIQGTVIWVGGSVTEFDVLTGTVVRVIAGPAYRFRQPDAIVLSGGDLFVANSWGGWITELNAATGRLVKIISGNTYPGPMLLIYDGPMVLSGEDLFVFGGTAVTELNVSMGTRVRVFRGFHGPGGTNPMALDGDDLFVGTYAGATGYSVTEVNIVTGTVVRVISGPAYRFNNLAAMELYGQDLFVANGSGSSVTQLNASTGALVRVIPGFDVPVAMALSGNDLFVANILADSVTELNASTSALVRVFSGPSYKFAEPDDIVLSGPDLFVANWTGNSITELPV